MLSAIRSRLADERGFTLIELLLATLIGTIVMLAASNLLDATGRASARVEDRADAVDRGRKAMEEITTRLRSQTCLNEFTPALVTGTSTSMDFYSVYGPAEPRAVIYGNSTRSLDVAQARRLSYEDVDPSAAVVMGIVERVWNSPLPYSSTDPNNPAVPAAEFATAPDSTRTVIRGIAQSKDGSTVVPIFKYFTFQNNNPATPDKLVATPVTGDDLPRVVRIEVAFDALPSRRTTDNGIKDGVNTDFRSEVFVRTADASQPETSPECF